MERDATHLPDPDDTAGGDVVRSVDLDCDADRAWALVATEDGLGRWLGGDVRLDPTVGGALGVRDDDGTVRVGRVLAAEEGRSLTFEWAPVGDRAARTTVTLTVEGPDPDGGGPGGTSRVTVVERPAGGARVAACLDAGAAWDQRLLGLELDVLAHGRLAVAPAL